MDIHLIDEHNEAYLCIEEAFCKGQFTKPITLIHVDSHRDMGRTFTRMSCYHPRWKKYAEEHLNIGNYITPLVLRKRIGRIIYVNAVEERSQKRMVGSYRGEGKIVRHIKDNEASFFPDRVTYMLRQTTDVQRLNKMVGDGPVVLDIDCDYFSCNSRAQAELAFLDYLSEAQKSAVKNYRTSNDRYKIRLSFPSMYDAFGNYMLTFNKSKRWISLCVDHFVDNMSAHADMVIVSRSLKSGFTPVRSSGIVVDRLCSRFAGKGRSSSIPWGERLKLYNHIDTSSDRIVNMMDGSEVLLSELQQLFVAGVSQNKTLKELKRILQREYMHDDIDYQLLRLIFNLKRQFILR